MTIMMIATMVPASAFAVESADGSSQQITKSSVKMTTSETLENGDVEINKSITGTDTENVFDITLDVTTAENLEEIPTSADAAVVLVVDRSGSMRWSISGEEDGSNERYNSAISAAKNFVTEFGKDAENSKRLVQVVQFSGDAVKKSSWGWEDVATETGLSGSKNDIETISEPSGGTNIEGGLQLAYNLINQAKNNETLKGISNVNVILLTDGCPTYHVKERTRNSTTEVEGEQGGGSWAEWEDHYSVTKTDGIAAKLKNLDVNGGKVSLYSIAFSAGTAQFAVNESNNETENKNVYDWLSSFSSKAFNSNNQQELINSFGKIVKIIKLGAQAWYVHDPMASNIIYKGAPSSSGDNVYTFSENKLLWDLKNSKPEVKEEGSKTYYHYSLKYPVALDTTTEGFAFDTSMPTNNATVLDYFMFSKIDEETTTELKHANFDVPEVKGLCGSLEFTKSDENGNPLKGAEFKLIGTAVGNGKDVTLKATSGADGKVSFSRIPSGTYKLTESGVPAGYTGDTTEYNVTVSYGKVTSSDIPGDGIINTRIKTKVEGKKVWVDGNNVSKTRPESITVKLMNGEDVVKTQTVTPDADGNWTYSFTELPKYDTDGTEITYTVKEEAVEGYTSKVDGKTITNTLSQVNDVKVEGKKVWVDGNNASNTRPESITVKLMNGKDVVKTQTVTPDAEGNWTYSFTNLPKYDEDYKVINYTVEEEAVEGYTSEVDVDGKTITNTLKQVNDVEVEGEKVWVDGDNVNKTRPESITVKLMNGKDVVKTQTVTPDAEGNWTYSFTELPKYDENYKVISYTVEEEAVEGYTSTVKGTTITNTLNQVKDVTVEGEKVWVDGDNADKTRPESITVKLMNGEDVVKTQTVTPDAEGNWTYSFTGLEKYDENYNVITYTVKEEAVEGYTSTVEGTTITNTIKQDTVTIEGTKTWIDPEGTVHPEITINLLRNGEVYKSVKLANGETSYKFEGLDKYDSRGFKYAYKVVEEEVPGYQTTYDNNNVVNTIIQEEISVSGTKTWIDPEGTKHPEITIKLLRDGEPYGDPITLKDGETDYSFDNLPKYDLTDGHIYEYTVDEVSVDGYTSNIDEYNITNTIKQDYVSVAGTKTWKDPEGTAHPAITINLLQDGTEIDEVVLQNGTTTYEFTDLEKYDLEDGHEYIYTVTEDSVEGYISVKDNNNFTNTIEPGQTTISGVKTWIAPQGTEFPTVKIVLLQNGNELDSVELTNGNTEYSFDVPVYDSEGQKYEYAIAEADVAGYTSVVDGYNVTNTIEQESIDIAGTKEWNAPEGTEVPDVTIDLLRDGEVVDSTVIKSGESEYSFTGLDKYDLSDGHVYDYNIQEEDTEGYSAEYDGYDIVNTINQNYVSVSGTKSWVAPEGTEFPDITINLLKNGEEVDEVVLQNGQTDFTFDGLEEYSYEEDGTVTVNEYTVTEDEVEGYTSSIDGYNITNEKNAEPVIPDDKPKTGDNFNIMLFAGAALAALLAALAIIFTRRRRNA